MSDAATATRAHAFPVTAGLTLLLAAWIGAGAVVWRGGPFNDVSLRLASIVFFILQVPVLVFVHEFGHYGVARLLGWRVPIFIWGSLVIRLTPFRVSSGAAPLGERVAGAIVAVPPLGRESRAAWIAIFAGGPLAGLSVGIASLLLSFFAHRHIDAGIAFAVFALLGIADAVFNLLPIRRGSDGWQILNLLCGCDVKRSANFARLSEQQINGTRPRDWPRELVTAMRIDNMWSGSQDAALYVYAVDMDRGAIASARAALDLAGSQDAVLAEKAFVAAYIDRDASAARAVLEKISAHRVQHTLGYWRAAAAIAVAENDTAAAREAIRKGRLVCESSAYATSFDREHFDALERRLENLA